MSAPFGKITTFKNNTAPYKNRSYPKQFEDLNHTNAPMHPSILDRERTERVQEMLDGANEPRPEPVDHSKNLNYLGGRRRKHIKSPKISKKANKNNVNEYILQLDNPMHMDSYEDDGSTDDEVLEALFVELSPEKYHMHKNDPMEPSIKKGVDDHIINPFLLASFVNNQLTPEHCKKLSKRKTRRELFYLLN